MYPSVVLSGPVGVFIPKYPLSQAPSFRPWDGSSFCGTWNFIRKQLDKMFSYPFGLLSLQRRQFAVLCAKVLFCKIECFLLNKILTTENINVCAVAYFIQMHSNCRCFYKLHCGIALQITIRASKTINIARAMGHHPNLLNKPFYKCLKYRRTCKAVVLTAGKIDMRRFSPLLLKIERVITHIASMIRYLHPKVKKVCHREILTPIRQPPPPSHDCGVLII